MKGDGERMDAEERAKMKAMGYAVVDDAADWLELTEVERQIVDLRVRLSREIRRRRTEAGLSQAQLAQKIGSSQSRVAKAEGTAPGVAIDLMIRVFFATGGTVDELAQAIGS
jgi:ribosome-binding protein aMBF1 (putative translation factor)